jgi:hypothetical protein
MKRNFQIIGLLCIIGVLVLVSACQETQPNTQVDSFTSCVAAGNPVMESYPRKCSDGVNTYVEVLFENVDDVSACTREYMPVCGLVDVVCVQAPCNPVQVTFANSCEAQNANATILYEGECRDNLSREEQLEGACLSFDGRWNAAYAECEYMPAQMCEDLGGQFNGCASACRHDPDAEMCTMQCVQVCSFD